MWHPILLQAVAESPKGQLTKAMTVKAWAPWRPCNRTMCTGGKGYPCLVGSMFYELEVDLLNSASSRAVKT